MINYTELDTAVIAVIKAGKTKFSQIHNDRSVNVVSTPLSHKPEEEFRVVDRRLQSLRKRNLITFEKGHWKIL